VDWSLSLSQFPLPVPWEHFKFSKLATLLIAKKSQSNIIQALRKNTCQPRTVYPANLCFNLDVEIRTIQNKGKIKWFISIKPALQKILRGISHMEEDEKLSQTLEVMKK
jgi:hypothetical protein